jgi:hypothetical protein
MNDSIYIIILVVAIWGFAAGYIIRGNKDE